MTEKRTDPAARGIYQQIREVLLQSRGRALLAVNTEMVTRYWPKALLATPSFNSYQLATIYVKLLK